MEEFVFKVFSVRDALDRVVKEIELVFEHFILDLIEHFVLVELEDMVVE
jgi:hypothetical protein